MTSVNSFAEIQDLPRRNLPLAGTALASAVKKHESELREMEVRKRELQELAQQQRFRPADEVTTFKIIKSTKELGQSSKALTLYDLLH